MIPLWLSESAGALGGSLAGVSAEVAVVLLALYLLTRLIRRAPPTARSAVWWLGSLKVLVACAGLTPFVLPVLPATASFGGADVPLVELASVQASVPTARAARSAPATQAEASRTPPASSFRLAEDLSSAALLLVLGVWAGGVAFGLLRWAAQLRRTRRLLADSVLADDPLLVEPLAEVSRAAGLRSAPALYLSPDAPAPFVTGPLRPAVVLPWDIGDRVDARALRMTLAHEVAHVRRGDLWLGWVPAAARTLFWFHPAVRLAAREYLQAREEACDAEAVRLTGGAPDAYGALLLSFGVLRSDTAAAGAHGASPAFVHLRRRLEMLEQAHTRPSRRSVMSGVVLAALAVLLVPFSIGAAQHPAAPIVPRVAAGVIWPEAYAPPVAPIAGPPFEWTEEELVKSGKRKEAPKQQQASTAAPTAASLEEPRGAVEAQAEIETEPEVATAPVAEATPADCEAEPSHEEGTAQLPGPDFQPDVLEHFGPVELAGMPVLPAPPELPLPLPLPVVAEAIAGRAEESAPRDDTELPRRLTARLAELGASIDGKTQKTIEKLIRKKHQLLERHLALQAEREALLQARAALEAEQEKLAARLDALSAELAAFDPETSCAKELRKLEVQLDAAERQQAALDEAREAIDRRQNRFDARLEATAERHAELEEELEESLEAAIEQAMERANLHGG